MSDRGNEYQEKPENWEQYSRMLGDLPLRSLPSGADGRLQARLDRAVASPNPRRPWLVGGLSLVGCGLAVIAGLAIFSPDDRPITPTQSRSIVIDKESPKRRHVRRPTAPRLPAPHVSETPVTIDSNIPRQIPMEPTQPQATTGGHDVRTGGSTAPAQPARPRVEPRNAP